MKVFAFTIDREGSFSQRIEILMTFNPFSYKYTLNIDGYHHADNIGEYSGNCLFGDVFSGAINLEDEQPYNTLAEIVKSKIETVLRRKLYNDVKNWYSLYEVKCPYKTASSFVEQECGWALNFSTDSLAEWMNGYGSDFHLIPVYDGYCYLNNLEDTVKARRDKMAQN